MKRPKEPHNLFFWLQIINNPEEIKAFQERGDKYQKLNLVRALKYRKWLNIQIR